MARDITVQFEDGSTATYTGAPDSVTPEAAAERAYKDYKNPIAAMDGGNGMTAFKYAPAAAQAQPPAVQTARQVAGPSCPSGPKAPEC